MKSLCNLVSYNSACSNISFTEEHRMATTGIKTANKQKLKLIEEGMEVMEEL